jgi:hypothetical protein
LKDAPEPRKSRVMIQVFDISDHDRLPWRFFGAMRAVLARS